VRGLVKLSISVNIDIVDIYVEAADSSTVFDGVANVAILSPSSSPRVLDCPVRFTGVVGQLGDGVTVVNDLDGLLVPAAVAPPLELIRPGTSRSVISVVPLSVSAPKLLSDNFLWLAWLWLWIWIWVWSWTWWSGIITIRATVISDDCHSVVDLRRASETVSVDSTRVEIKTTTSSNRHSQRLSLELIKDLLWGVNSSSDQVSRFVCR